MVKNLSDWKKIYGDIESRQEFEQKGLKYLREHRASFSRSIGAFQVLKSGNVPFYIANQFRAQLPQIRQSLHSYIMATSFFIDTHPEVARDHINLQIPVVEEYVYNDKKNILGLLFTFRGYCNHYLGNPKSMIADFKSAKRSFEFMSPMKKIIKEEIDGELSLDKWVKWYMKLRGIREGEFTVLVGIYMDAVDLARKSGHNI